jgi:hypothetical protein
MYYVHYDKYIVHSLLPLQEPLAYHFDSKTPAATIVGGEDAVRRFCGSRRARACAPRHAPIPSVQYDATMEQEALAPFPWRLGHAHERKATGPVAGTSHGHGQDNAQADRRGIDIRRLETVGIVQGSGLLLL